MPRRPFRIGRSNSGLGLFAVKPIKRTVQVAMYRGWRITRKEADRREARGAKYLFDVTQKITIDGSPRWNIARYINHSCRPNCTTVGRKGAIAIVALRRIEPGEEITYNYGSEYFSHIKEGGGCRCAWCLKRAAARRRKQRMSKTRKKGSRMRSSAVKRASS